MNLKTNLETYELYDGTSPHEVIEKHEENQKYWRFSLFGTKKSKQFRINPFEDSCIGVYMSQHNNQFGYKMIMTQNSKYFCLNILFIFIITIIIYSLCFKVLIHGK